MERQMGLATDILRFMTIRVEEHEKEPSIQMRKSDRDDRRDDRRGDRGDRGDRPPRGPRRFEGGSTFRAGPDRGDRGDRDRGDRGDRSERQSENE
jgi:small subunit ribosomal protein S6